MKRKFRIIAIAGIIGMSMVGCNTSDKQDIQQTQDITNQEKGFK